MDVRLTDTLTICYKNRIFKFGPNLSLKCQIDYPNSDTLDEYLKSPDECIGRRIVFYADDCGHKTIEECGKPSCGVSLWSLKDIVPVTMWYQMDETACVPLKIMEPSKGDVDIVYYFVYDIETIQCRTTGKLIPYLAVNHLYHYDYSTNTNELLEDVVVNMRDAIDGETFGSMWVKLLFEWMDRLISHCESSLIAPSRCKMCVMGYNSSGFDDIFITKELQEYLRANDLFGKYDFKVRGGKIIGNSLRYRGGMIAFVDVMRYIGAPAPLRDTAKGFGVPIGKGDFPMKILVDGTIQDDVNSLLDNDGFFHRRNFFLNSEYQRAKDEWDQRFQRISDIKKKFVKGKRLTSVEKRYMIEGHSIKEAELECLRYCELDVIATWGVWVRLHEIILPLTYEAFTIKLERLDDHFGAPSLMKCIALLLATRAVSHIPGNQLFVAQGRAQGLIRETIYGGWVGAHVQGVITPDLLKTCRSDEYCMVDIVSHYPCSVTIPMPIGPTEKLNLYEGQKLLNDLKNVTVNELKYFFVEVIATPPPEGGHSWLSSLPVRHRRSESSKLLNWGYRKAKGCWNSLHLWIGAQDGWTYEMTQSGYIYRNKAVLYRDYVDIFADMKTKGKAEKNNAKVNFAKVGMNSMIGKLGEKIKRDTVSFVEDEHLDKAMKKILKDPTKVLTKREWVPNLELWKIECKRYDWNNPTIPSHHASIMYAGSHLIRWVMMQSVMKVSSFHLPALLYGDTDSMIITKSAWEQMKKDNPGIEGKRVDGYDVVLGKYVFHVELELDYITFGIFVSQKTYCVWNSRTGEIKLRAKGFRSVSPNELCVAHEGQYEYSNCPKCRCRATSVPTQFCRHCILSAYYRLSASPFIEEAYQLCDNQRQVIEQDRPLAFGSNCRVHGSDCGRVYIMGLHPQFKVRLGAYLLRQCVDEKITAIHLLLAVGGTDIVVSRRVLSRTTHKKVGPIAPYSIFSTISTRTLSKVSTSSKYSDLEGVLYPITDMVLQECYLFRKTYNLL